MKTGWRAEALVAAVLFAGTAAIGWALGFLVLALLVAAALYLIWHLLNAALLYRRLRGFSVAHAPRNLGLWEDIRKELVRLEHTRRDFVGNASHELRTPLTVLRGYLDMINDEASTGKDRLAEWRQPLGDMLRQSERMERIVGDMLALARLESESAEAGADPLDVPGQLEHIVAEAESLSNGEHNIHLLTKPGLCLMGQDDELQSVFSNLIMNAVRHTPPGSTVTVRWEKHGQGARFSVTDDGPGISTEDIPRLTQRFYRVDVGRSRASGGTGLGLAIVKHALERHDSALNIESAPGSGATFSCIFPPRRIVVDGPPH